MIVGSYLDGARACALGAVHACGSPAEIVGDLDLGPELKVQADALRETCDAFESGLAVDSAQVWNRRPDRAPATLHAD